jgi:outer membrane protein OmpA-like peptidoglycan-associated protein
MLSRSQSLCGRVALMRLAVLIVLCSVGTFAAAQDQPPPKWELFGGYSYLYPDAGVHGMLPGGVFPAGSRLESNPRGAGASITYDFNRWFGLTLDSSIDWGSGETGVAKRIDDAAFSNLSFGPKVTFRHRRVSPFIEALVGDHRLMPDAFHDIDKVGFMFGGGLDVNVSRHLALRLFRVDYVMSSYRYGPPASTPSTDLTGARLQAGLVFMWGGNRTVTPASAVCSVNPGEVFVGEPVTATASGSNFNPKRKVTYTWTGSGVKPHETGDSTVIDTTVLQAGAYQVTASLSDGSQTGGASCTARFSVKEARPPVISCSSEPASVVIGGTSTITSVASSPDGRILSYSYSTSVGNITGRNSTATLNTSGAQPGAITVTCNASDDRSQPLTASASTTVNLRAPPPPLPDIAVIAAIEKRLALHSVYFATAKPSLENPDAGLLASQEKTLTALASDFLIYLQVKPDARLTLEGHADPRGSVEYNQTLSERRVDRVKRFLVVLNVPAANIQTQAFGQQQNLTDRQVKSGLEQNPELSPEDRQRVLHNMRTIILASNRRVDITLSNAGQAPQESVRQYPFNAADSLTLLKEEGTKKTSRPAARRKTKPKAQQ